MRRRARPRGHFQPWRTRVHRWHRPASVGVGGQPWGNTRGILTERRASDPRFRWSEALDRVELGGFEPPTFSRRFTNPGTPRSPLSRTLTDDAATSTNAGKPTVLSEPTPGSHPSSAWSIAVIRRSRTRGTRVESGLTRGTRVEPASDAEPRANPRPPKLIRFEVCRSGYSDTLRVAIASPHHHPRRKSSGPGERLVTGTRLTPSLGTWEADSSDGRIHSYRKVGSAVSCAPK